MNTRMIRVRLLVGLMALLSLVGCQSLNSGVGGMLNLDTDLSLELHAGNNINPDEAEHASPVYLRFYQLRADTQFKKTGFLELYEQDKEVLGSDFVAKTELKPIRPGQDRSERFLLQAETRYVALFAEFFQYDNATYKLIVPVTSNNVIRDHIKVVIDGNQIALNLEK